MGPHFQTPRSSSKILCCISYLQFSSWCLEFSTKHGVLEFKRTLCAIIKNSSYFLYLGQRFSQSPLPASPPRGGEAAVTLYEYLSMNIQILSWQACVINSDGSPAVYTAHGGSTELCVYNYSTQVSKDTKDYDREFHCRFQNYFTRRTHCTPRDHIHVLQSTKFHNVIT